MAPNRGSGGRRNQNTQGKKSSSAASIRNVVVLLFLLQLAVALWLVSKQFGDHPTPPSEGLIGQGIGSVVRAADAKTNSMLTRMNHILDKHQGGFKGTVLYDTLPDPAAPSSPSDSIDLSELDDGIDGGGGGGGGGDPKVTDSHNHRSFMKEMLPDKDRLVQQDEKDDAKKAKGFLRASADGSGDAGGSSGGGSGSGDGGRDRAGGGGGELVVSGGTAAPNRNVSTGVQIGIGDSGKCTVLHPKIIIYNRIPKCASGSMNIFIEEAKMKREGSKHQFVICRSSLYTNRHLNPTMQKQYVNDPFRMSHCRNKPAKEGDLAILSRHIFYLNFEPFGKPNPAYVNIIRQPIDRCVSRFYYERDARGTVRGNMDMDTCMAKGGPCKFVTWAPKNSVATGSGSRIEQMREECSSNYLSRWFCGMDGFCRDNNQAVLEAAKLNMRDKYAFVGLTAQMKVSFSILQKIIPDFFGSEGMPMDICNKCKDKGDNKTGTTTPGGHAVKPPLINAENRAYLERLNPMDLDLYAYAEDLFWAKAESCGAGTRSGR